MLKTNEHRERREEEAMKILAAMEIARFSPFFHIPLSIARPSLAILTHIKDSAPSFCQNASR